MEMTVEKTRGNHVEEFANFLMLNFFNDKLVVLGLDNDSEVAEFNSHDFYITPVGVDIDLDKIMAARSKYPNYNFELQEATSLKLSFANDSIGAFFSTSSMNREKAEKIMREIVRTLKPGGYAYIHFYMLDNPDDKAYPVDTFWDEVYAMTDGLDIRRAWPVCLSSEMSDTNPCYALALTLKKPAEPAADKQTKSN